MNKLDAKLLHFNLNLDYQQNGLSKENQVNQLINKIINKIIIDFKDENNKYFVLDYKDDTISLIAYNILKQVQNFSSNPILIYGKEKNELKKFLKDKKEKFISNFTFNKLLKKNKLILFTCDNPIYKVNKVDICFKENSNYNFMKDFTIEEIQIAKTFYSIQDIEKDTKLFSSSAAQAYDSICRGKVNDSFDWRQFKFNLPDTINIINLTGDNKEDSRLINEVIDKNEIIMYNISSDFESYQILSSEFQFFLKNKSNIPTYWNINAYEIVHDLKLKNPNLNFNFIGDFTNEERNKWLT